MDCADVRFMQVARNRRSGLAVEAVGTSLRLDPPAIRGTWHYISIPHVNVKKVCLELHAPHDFIRNNNCCNNTTSIPRYYVSLDAVYHEHLPR